jgi:hypothetical protein
VHPEAGMVGFNAVRHLPHARTHNIMMGHRLVILPDWQGLGLGWRFDEWMGEFLHLRGFRYHNVTSHPGLIRAFNDSPRWEGQKRVTKLNVGKNAHKAMGRAALRTRRLSAHSWTYRPALQGPAGWMTVENVPVPWGRR